MVQIGSVTIKGPAVLAPMAGTADRAFREICASFGAAYVISEMVSAKALTYGDKKSRELMELSSQERPAAIQLFGDDPQTMAEAAVLALEYQPEIIDLNMSRTEDHIQRLRQRPDEKTGAVRPDCGSGKKSRTRTGNGEDSEGLGHPHSQRRGSGEDL